MRDFFKNADNVWPDDLPLIPQEPDPAVFRGHTTPQPVFGESFFEPRHEAPRNRRRFVPGVPWFLAAAAVVFAAVLAVDPFGETTLTYPSPTAQPAPKPAPAVTRTVRVTAPAVTVQAAPRPAQTVYATATVTKTAEPKPAVTVTTTKTVTADPENEVAP